MGVGWFFEKLFIGNLAKIFFLNIDLPREPFQVLHPDFVQTLVVDRASPKISNREKILGPISLKKSYFWK